MPYFSVVIPVYNRAFTIETALRSCLLQTFHDFEIIIVDDGSSDSGDLQRGIASLNDRRLQYVWRENGGGGAARNTGIDAAQGRYVAFLDSDDLFLRHKLDRFAERIGSQRGLAGYSYAYVDRGVEKAWIRPSRPIRADEDMGEYLFVANEFVQTSTIVIDKEIAAQVRFDPKLRKGQDLDFCVRLHAAGVRFFMIEEPLVVWTDHSEEGRTSRTRGYEAPAAWLASTGSLLTPKAQRGYRATVLAYYMAPARPFAALLSILDGTLRAGVPPRVMVRQLARSFLPRSLYRGLVTAFVRAAGTPKS